MTSIKDVARECNVSIATVSNILNGKAGASKETARRVQEAAKRLNYKPNIMAKNLKQRTTDTIGILVEDLSVFNVPEILDGISEYCDTHNIHFILSNLRLYKKYGHDVYDTTEHMDDVYEEFRMLQAKQVEGIIYVATHCKELLCIPDNFPLPIVTAYSYAKNRNIPSVVFNDEQGAYEATIRLIKAGDRDIGLICGPSESVHTRQRLIGYQRALFENGILFNPNNVQYANWGREEGYLAAKKLFNAGIRTFFTMNDIMAGGVYDLANDNGMKVGKEISVVGFDNRVVCEAYNPGLATMELPLSQLGKKTAEILLSILNNTYVMDEQIYRIDCEFIQRGSLVMRNPDNMIEGSERNV